MFTAIVVSCENEPGLRDMLGQLRYQTRPPDRTIVFAADQPLDDLREEFTDVEFVETVRMNDWGHHDRARGLAMVEEGYVGFFNDDDLYEPNFIESMMTQAEQGADVVYCAWNTHPNCSFSLGSSTSGNYIFKAELGHTVQYKERCYEADGIFIDALRTSAKQIDRIDSILYHHNKGVR